MSDENRTYEFNKDIDTEYLNRPRFDEIPWNLTFATDPPFPATPCHLPLQTLVDTSYSYSITSLAGVDFNLTYVNGFAVTEVVYRYETVTYTHSVVVVWDPCSGVSNSSRSDSEQKMEHFEAVKGFEPIEPAYSPPPIKEKEEVKKDVQQSRIVTFTSTLNLHVPNVITSAHVASKVQVVASNNFLIASDFNARSNYYTYAFDESLDEVEMIIPMSFVGVWSINTNTLFFYTQLDFMGNASKIENNINNVVIQPGNYTFKKLTN